MKIASRADTTVAPTAVCTAGGEPCVFPFKYNNRLYNSCTTADGDANWCAIAVDSDGKMTDYNYCDSNCNESNGELHIKTVKIF